jgi:hypothetical protein
MESCSNQKSVKQIQIYFIFEILQIATLCLDDSFAHSWYSLQCHLECFSNSLEKVSTYSEHFVGCFSFTVRSDSSQNHLNLVDIRELWRPGHLKQHSITLLLDKKPLNSLKVCWVIVLLKNK